MEMSEMSQHDSTHFDLLSFAKSRIIRQGAHPHIINYVLADVDRMRIAKHWNVNAIMTGHVWIMLRNGHYMQG